MKTTVKSILSALLSGAIAGAAQAQQGGVSLKGTGVVASAGALVGLVNYLANSPLAKAKAEAEAKAPAAADEKKSAE